MPVTERSSAEKPVLPRLELPPGVRYASTLAEVRALYRDPSIAVIIVDGEGSLSSEACKFAEALFKNRSALNSFCYGSRDSGKVKAAFGDWLRGLDLDDSASLPQELLRFIEQKYQLTLELEPTCHPEGRAAINWKNNDRPHVDGQLTVLAHLFGPSARIYGRLDGPDSVGKRRFAEANWVAVNNLNLFVDLQPGQYAILKSNGVHSGPPRQTGPGVYRAVVFVEAMERARFTD